MGNIMQRARVRLKTWRRTGGAHDRIDVRRGDLPYERVVPQPTRRKPS